MTPTSDKPVKNGNLWMILAVVILSVTPLIFIRGDYEGADEQAENLIGEIQPNYQPWFEPILEVPSGEIESLLFVSQAAIGAGIVGYVIGLYKGRKQGKNRSS
ncbi:MAG: energy-coupling factor ABC transporter substrate-binding protein [Limnospira sp. PMC 1291.21]|uniref:Cobalt transport protein CbiN n=2 Tax=Limnospira TaxID=2596745 RepID=B5W9L3_LIMMA|nr:MULTISPECIES: energy-coupling factor ABC transporter substrate-binding protein [Limnospira]EKD06090.1 cobalt transport protein CbiN [Arthrospira platensis C1]MDC0838169.1 energy-coupling factor ABC transporter substrate-binding protein [Limnoraphis robusta]MDY7054739.1 energy-coupling factor ABC transporter substrate-binding protein [Limnospira fusiformis LS22]QJB26665.1 energy-coupling factor ABC transporter substrate-binding protein [Limnospira fusiformis SAG 85.79]EDZ91781.1 Cobalt trans